MTLSPRAHLRREDGQAMAELALVLPILVSVMLGIVQFGIIFNNYVTMTDAARAGARKAAVSRFVADNGASAEAVVYADATSLDPSKLDVSVDASPDWATAGGDVTVTASYPYEINILGIVVKSGTLTTTTKERLEGTACVAKKDRRRSSPPFS
jgi:Flp pilus assembly protein TadG